MKKTYIAPKAAVECHFAEVMQISVNSVGLKGSVQENEDTTTNWDFDGNGGKDDDPDAKASSIWDDWTAEGEEEE